MKQRSRIDIAATPQVIWPVVADAEWLAGWNEKIVSVKALGARQPALSANYEFTFSNVEFHEDDRLRGQAKSL